MGFCGFTYKFNAEFEVVVNIICICCVLEKKFFEIKIKKNLPSTYYCPRRLPDMSIVSIKIEVAKNADDIINDLEALKLKKIGL